MMKSFLQVIALIPCPDSEARNIWQEFWTDNTRPFAKSLNDAQLLYMHKYLKTKPHSGIPRESWNKYFRVRVELAILKSKSYLAF